MVKITAGMRDEPLGEFNGLAHTLEHLISGGNRLQIKDILAKYSGGMNAMTNDKMTGYYFNVENS
jgi:secreted Zn-dependent insulinase-like peptidase